jgi:gliding motility-associated-like protein
VKRLVAPFDFEDLGLNGDDGSITIIDPQNITVALDTQDVSCNGGDDGAFTLTVTGGTAPYIFVYAKSGGGGLMGPDTIFTDGGSFTVSDLDAGLYIITTGDQSVPQTISTDSVLISEPPIPLGVGPDIAGGFTEPLCFGDSTGAFPVKVSGGTAPYSFLWNTGDTVEDLIGIPAGFYQITVTDDNGCTAIAGATLSNPAQLLTTTGGIDASCSGSDDGTAFVTAIGGTLNTTNYSYLWSNVPPSAADTVNNLDVGQYFVTVTDDNGCMAVDSVTIGAATIIQANALISQISCFGADDGSIDLNPSAIGIDNGGYFFNWNPLIAGPNDDLADDLGPGNYAFTITDAVGCNIDSVVTISEPDLLDVTLVGTTNESCGTGNDGSITVSASGGTLATGSDYTFDWGAAGQGSMITGLSAGDYTVTVTDDNGCIDSLTATILPPDAPDIISFDITDVPCATSTSGEITVNAVPGGAPITSIDWSNGDSGATITNLAPGPYIVTVTAQDGCEAVDTAVVDAPLPLISTDTLLTAPLCAGQCNGAISVAISGGTQPYSYSWSNGGNTNPIFGLCAGTYTVTVTDANFCPPLVLELELVDPAPLVAEVDPASIAGVSCFNGIPCDGQAAATATGGGAGTGDYVFQWSSGTVEMGSGSSVTNLCQDEQIVIVSDANNCLDTAFFIIPSPPPVELDPDNTIIESVSCNGDTDGSATVAGTGGTPDPVNGYTYFWPFNNSTSPTVTNLAPGLYQVQITDGNGCQVLADIEIGEPDALDINSDSLIHVSCFEGMDGKLSVSTEGGNPGPVTYQWSDNIGSGATVSNLSAGPYTVTATDSRGCTATATFIINEPPPLFIEFDSLPSVRCFGETVTLSIDTVGGGSGQSYQVYGEDPIRGNIIYPLENLLERVPGGPGVVIVEDENGCILETNVFIDEPPPVEVVIEAAGFFGQDEVEIELGDSLELELNLVQVFLPIDTIQWSPLEDIRSFPNGDLFTVLVKPLDDMEYTVQVTDEDGCIGIDVIEIIVDKNRNVYVPNIFSPNGDGRNDFFEISIGPGVEIVNFMQVYDRWGELIFEAGDFLPELNNTVKWDGTFNGKMMNPGAYVYLIEVEFVDGTTLLYRGTVTLVR